MKRSLSFVLFFIPVFLSFSQNLVINPGFESWQKINKPTGWTTALNCLKDSAIINTGTYSCRQSTSTDSKELGQVIPVTAGNQYRIAFWYINDPVQTGNGCRIWSSWKDADGNSIADEVSLPLLHSGYLKSESWKEYSAEITAPPNAGYFNLVIRTLPNSITFWDDIVFEENVPTGESELDPDNIIVYPNPACNYLIINNIQNLYNIDIQTITGYKMISRKTNGEESIMIPLSGFKNGIYIICIKSPGKLYTKRFIKIS